MPMAAMHSPLMFQHVQAAPSSAASPNAAVIDVPTSTAALPEQPLTPEEQKAADTRLVFDRLLVDAAVRLTELENYRRGRSKTPVSLSAFRSLEIRLNQIADADPSNTQAREMARNMQMAQFQLLQPSVEVAAAADRQLYASAMSEKMQADGVKVTTSGRDSRVVRFTSPHMTRDMSRQLAAREKIPDQVRRLEFRSVIFSNGRRSWRYAVPRNRTR